jgi:parallel beta-helix repeat protein
MKTEIIKIDVIAWQLKIALLFAILCFGIGLVAAIPQQDYTLYGTATLNGKVLTAQDDAVISLKVEGMELVSYTMGDIPGTDNYVLIVPLDSEPGVTTAAQEGETAYIYINGIPISEGAQIIGAPGTTVQFDISATSVSKVTVLYPNGGESIPVGTQVQVSARATDDKGVTSVTFYYSSGTSWNSIGAGTRVSGTNKEGIWNKTWDTDGLSAGANYLIKAVASDGTLTREDQSDSTFSLTPTKVIRVPVDYPTIQAAVDAACAGNTIIVGEGIYTENVKVNKALTIKSTSGNPADTIVLAADPDADVFSVTADYVTISGFTVGGAVEHTDAGIYLDNASYSYISDNTISNNSFGIYLRDSSNNSIVSNNVSSNNYDGICLYYHNNDNNIRNNTVLNNSDGISLYGSDSNNILDNNVPNCRICLAHFSNNNKLINNNVHGIGLASSNNNSIIRNKVSSNEGFGIYLINSSKNYIVENIVSMCKMHGVYLSLSSNNNTIISNSVLFNRIGIYLDSTNNNIICLNNFIKNGNNVHSYNSTNIWNSTEKITYTYNGNTYTSHLGNYWDDYTGSDADEDGIGDTPYGINLDKDFYPLLMPVENYIKQPTITVDTIPPVITCPADVTVELETIVGTVVPLEATATDNCDPNPTITSNKLDIYPLGTTIVTFTATDASGNSASCSTNVTVYGPKEIEQRIWPSEAPVDGTIEFSSDIGITLFPYPKIF